MVLCDIQIFSPVGKYVNYYFGERPLILWLTRMVVRYSVLFMAITRQELVNIIQGEQGDKSLRSYATYLGISPAYLSDFYHGRRDPGIKLLGQFGYRRQRTVTDLYLKTRKVSK